MLHAKTPNQSVQLTASRAGLLFLLGFIVSLSVSHARFRRLLLTSIG